MVDNSFASGMERQSDTLFTAKAGSETKSFLLSEALIVGRNRKEFGKMFPESACVSRFQSLV